MCSRYGSACVPTRRPWFPRCKRAASQSRFSRAIGSRPSRAAAQTLGINEWRAGVTPADKIARIEDLKRKSFKVMMVGDGLNDAPALAAAHVSMSPISAAHLSQATADLVFLGKPLARWPQRSSFRARRF
jgi:hypothetical protein